MYTYLGKYSGYIDVHASSVSIHILESIPVALMCRLRRKVYLSWKVFRLHRRSCFFGKYIYLGKYSPCIGVHSSSVSIPSLESIPVALMYMLRR